VFATHSSKPHSSLRGMTAYVRISIISSVLHFADLIQPRIEGEDHSHNCLRLDSEADLSNLLIIALKSINLASFRKSSCGLHKKGYFFPSLPWKTNFLGRCNEGMISTRSSIPTYQLWVSALEKGKELTSNLNK
jgi:hypothetical protein